MESQKNFSNSGSLPTKVKADLAAGPSIMDLFTQAKKLLTLQPRIENRHTRQESSRAQRGSSGSLDSQANADQSFLQNNKEKPANSHTKVLDLLSPLSVDDLRGPSSTSVTTRKVTKSRQEIRLQEGVTPRSLDSSPNNSQEEAPSQASFKDRGHSQYVDVSLEKGTFGSPVPNGTTAVKEEQISAPLQQAQPPLKSNLTSSLRSQSTQEKNGEKLPSASKNGSTATDEKKPTECNNCSTIKTPLWRKDPDGNTLCNACGLFLKLHGTTRPLSLKTDVIRKRSSRRASATPRGPGSVPVSTAMPGNLSRHGSYVMDFSKGRQDFGNGFSMSNSPMSVAPGAYNYSYGSMGSSGYLSEASKPKNVRILPKPSGGNSFQGVVTPNNERNLSIYMGNPNHFSTPSSPYSTSGSSQFKRKKSEVSIPEMADSYGRRLVSSNGLSNSYTNIGPTMAKRGIVSGTPQAKNNYVAGLARTNSLHSSSVPMNTAFAKYPSGSQVPPAPAANNFYFDQISGASPHTYQRNSISRPSGGSINSEFTPYSVPSPPLFDEKAHRSSFIVPSDIQGYDAYSKGTNDGLPSPVKNEDDMDTDDFFKNYTSLHSEASGETTSPETALMGDMGGRLEIKPTTTKSTLTHGLKGDFHVGPNPEQANPPSDLDWLKFEI